MQHRDPNEGQHRAHMDAAIREGATPGNPEGSEIHRGCGKCSYGIISQPDVWNCGVPPFIARAMALDLDGICYTVYCDCKAGEGAMAYDQATRHRMDTELKTVSVVRSKDEHGNMVTKWGGDAPDDCIPGKWWGRVRDICQSTHFGGDK
jgi:hypothetical protein